MPKRPADFWPSTFPTVDVESPPVALLKEQADLLSGKTHNHVQGVLKESVIQGTVYYSLYLQAPALGDYMFKILSISHPLSKGGEEPFPLDAVMSAGSNAPRKIETMDEYEEWLRHVLSSDEVMATVANLIRQSKRATEKDGDE